MFPNSAPDSFTPKYVNFWRELALGQSVSVGEVAVVVALLGWHCE